MVVRAPGWPDTQYPDTLYPHEANIWFYAEPVAPAILERFGRCWLCDSANVVGFDTEHRCAKGFSNLCRRCIPAAKVLATLRRTLTP